MSRWEAGPLKHWVEVSDSGAWGDDPTGDDDAIVLRSTDISLDGAWSLSGVAERHLSPRERFAKRLREGDIVIVKSSGSPEHLGKAAIVDASIASLRPCFSNFVQRVRPAMNADPRYVWYFFNSHRAAAEIEMAGNTTTGLRNLNSGIIGGITFPGPTRDEQRAIANFLDAETARIDALIAKKRQLSSTLEERAGTASGDWFSALTRAHGEVPIRRWVTRLEQGWSPVCDNYPALPGEWGVLKTSAVSSGVFNPAENKRLPDNVEPELRWAVRDGDLLMTRGSGSPGSVGQAAVVRAEGRRLTISDLLYRLGLGPIEPEFAAGVLRSPPVRRQIEGSIRSDAGQTLKLRGEDILSLTVPDVPREEQQRALVDLSQRVAACDEGRRLLGSQITLLKDRRQALITAAVTGQLDIPGAA